MLVSRGRNPSATEVITQLVQNPELRGRVLTTLGLLMLVRLGIYIPMPGIDRVAFEQFIEQGGTLIGFLDIFTGGGISTLGVFALGILPFINASIIIQLLTASLPQLEDLTEKRRGGRSSKNRPNHALCGARMGNGPERHFCDDPSPICR
jgi:preprotein translocase subunit SecY